ncbi:ketopantoate reductase family protein [Shewanella avicenniae]|uniref:2-dehydropantoate 2-reductase n=1 Tax=Shewanella avicenniae TaxID=2814294 RepID=A0ABX7QRU4_9GAMM|nr:ketopantoate reductase family protein [Shewanella avicenniae]QSX34184.1 ketopantoate reductase family protein [Shewanella avicenniae]
MRFVVLGAGGIGCYYAARLLAAGHQALLVARGEHLTALQQQGLTLKHPQFSFNEAVAATDVIGLMRDYSASDFDWLLLAAKSSATEPLMLQLADWLNANPELLILSLQNGVDNEAHIASVVGQERTVGGLAVKIGAHIIAPGNVEATGVAQVDFGAWPNQQQNPTLQSRLMALAEVFTHAQIPNTVYDNVSYALWRKLVINNAVNPLTALTLLNTRELTQHSVFTHTVKTMMQETGRAANAEGVHLTEADIEEMYQLICGFDAIKTSMLVDRLKGRTMEIDDICGPVIRGCIKAGKPATTTELIAALLRNAVQ